jgi:ribonuclease HII
MPRAAITLPPCPDLAFETALGRDAGGPIAGLDEAGRGPWAGPVVAAAVILDPARLPSGIDDSKQLSEAARERLFDVIHDSALVGVGIVGPAEIDRVNILQATFTAMRQALAALPSAPAAALVDGNRDPHLPCRCQLLVKGDARSLSIAAASIIAKVTRDRLMRLLAADYPDYGFERHKGYGTPAHLAALDRHGPTPHHRRSFAPVRRIIERALP